MRKTYIDNEDIYDVYGAFLLEGSEKNVLQFPSSKEPMSNSWQEYDGIEADLEELCLEAFPVPLRFAFVGEDRVGDFNSMLMSKPKHSFLFAIGRELEMRLVSSSSPVINNGLIICEYNFECYSHPVTQEDFVRVNPVPLARTDNRYLLDGVPFSNYGILMLDGTESSIRTVGEIKSLLSRQVGKFIEYDLNPLLYSSGRWVRDTSVGAVRKGARDIVLKCLFTASSYLNAVNNLDALLYDLIVAKQSSDITKKCVRAIKVPSSATPMSCYYKSMRIGQYYSSDSGIVVFTFDLTLGYIY